jgi:hypothetical protein
MRLEADHLAVHQQVAETASAATAADVVVVADVWMTDALVEAQRHADGQSTLLLHAAEMHCWAADGHLGASLKHLRGFLKHLRGFLKHLKMTLLAAVAADPAMICYHCHYGTVGLAADAAEVLDALLTLCCWSHQNHRMEQHCSADLHQQSQVL